MSIIERRECPVCSTEGGDLRQERWRECLRCRLWYQFSFERLPELEDLENNVRRNYHTDKKTDDFDIRFEEKRSSHTRRRDVLLKHANLVRSVCELGFGGGILLRLLYESGRYACGIEVVRRYVTHANMAGYEAFWCDVSKRLPSGLTQPVDLVVGSEMMEHVERPVDFLRGARNLVRRRDGLGAFSFAVPDGRSRETFLSSSSELQYWREDSIREVVKRSGWHLFDIKVGSTVAFAWLTVEE